MKRIICLIVMCGLILSFIPVVSNAQDGLIATFSGENEEKFSLSKKAGENVSVENKMIVGTGEGAVGFTISFKEPVTIKDVNSLVKHSFMVECEEKVNYVAMRLYSERTNKYATAYMGREIENGKWYDGEFKVSQATYKVGQAPILPGDKIKSVRIDLVNPSGKLAKLYVKQVSFYEAEEIKNIKRTGQEEIDRVAKALEIAKAGDTLTIKNGTYENVSMIFYGNGTKEKPITIKAETPGGVIINGYSHMVIGGTGVTVDGILFEKGYSPNVVYLAPNSNNCRFTNSAIISWNQENRENITKWVEIFGVENRVDHCFFRGKDGQGQLLQVVRDADVEQKHLIDNNYFGYYAPGIKNGCETVRICNTTDVNANCNSTVMNNFFDKANGENEVISNKSNDNKYINNTFYDSQGSLCLRIGKRCLVEGNLFIGGGTDISRTMGITIIDENHIVKNNYLYNLPPSAYGIALTNGTDPNPAAYEHVKNANVSNNTIINCNKGISVGTFSYMTDVAYPRIYPPQGTVKDNFLHSSYATYKTFSLDDKKTDKVVYSGNVVNGNSDIENSGITVKDVELIKKSNGLYFPKENIGADYNVVSKAPMSPLEFLPDWIKEKVNSGNPDFAISQINIDITPKDEIVLLQLDNTTTYTYLKGKETIDSAPMIVEGSTLVPLRYLSETFGFDVVWFEEEQKVKLKKDNGVNYIEFAIGSDKMNKNGTEVSIANGAKAQLINSRTYIPLRAAAEAIDRTVHWDDRGYIIITANNELVVDNSYFDKSIEFLK